MKKKKLVKIKLEYINEKLSKKPQIIIGEIIGHEKKLTRKIKIKRKIAHEFVIQTFNLKNFKQIKNLSII
jgi:hypothetical protein